MLCFRGCWQCASLSHSLDEDPPVACFPLGDDLLLAIARGAERVRARHLVRVAAEGQVLEATADCFHGSLHTCTHTHARTHTRHTESTLSVPRVPLSSIAASSVQAVVTDGGGQLQHLVVRGLCHGSGLRLVDGQRHDVCRRAGVVATSGETGWLAGECKAERWSAMCV